MLTNALHDELWIQGARSLPGICNALDTANAIAIARELYALGEISKQGYTDLLERLLDKTGCMLDRYKEKEA